MPSIKDLQSQIQALRDQAQTEGQQAQQEREKADQYRADDNLGEMQSHLSSSSQHDRKQIGYESQINTLTIEMNQIQHRVEQLREKRILAERTRDQELAQIDAEIQQLTGE